MAGRECATCYASLKKRRLLGAGVSAVRIEPEMAICLRARNTPARRALEKSVLYEERLVDFLESAHILSDRCGDGADTDRSTLELLDDGLEDARVHVVESELIDLEQL